MRASNPRKSLERNAVCPERGVFAGTGVTVKTRKPTQFIPSGEYDVVFRSVFTSALVGNRLLSECLNNTSCAAHRKEHPFKEKLFPVPTLEEAPRSVLCVCVCLL